MTAYKVAMANAIFTTKISPSYHDVPERFYHFPKTYLNQVQAALGDQIVYYEPRRGTADRSSSGGRQAYFAVALVKRIVPDPSLQDHYYAEVEQYLGFDVPVPFKAAGSYLESGLRKSDGSTNKGAFGRAVRNIPRDEFEAILALGFQGYLSPPIGPKDQWEQQKQTAHGFAEEALEFQRPIIEITSRRPFRDNRFRHQVREAYEQRCAITGIKILNGGGRPEVEAAHIIPVEENGTDSVRNGLALSGTVHWMFDRGLISVDEDYRVIAAKGAIPDGLSSLITPGREIALPNDQRLWPHQVFLEHHRSSRFKG
jgi:putative restriction endonuclease